MAGLVDLNAMILDLTTIRALVLDVDGVLYEGNSALVGAAELIAHLHAENVPFVLLSNNTFRSVSQHVEKLAGLGIHVVSEEILTSALITARVLAREAGRRARCYVIGEEGLLEALNEVGLEVLEAESDVVDYVVVGMDRRLTYDKLRIAALAIRRGARFISSNPDPAYPTDEGLIPASGAIQAALEVTTGVKALITGKPGLEGFRLALDRLGSTPEVTAMVGDQVSVDILGAQQVGLKGVLILSSVTPRFDPASSPVQPNAVFESTAAFLEAWMRRK